MYNERNQEVHGNHFNSFEKIFIWGKWAISGPKVARSYNSGSTVRIFLKYCTVSRDQEVHGIYINGYPKKNSQLGHFGPTISPYHNSGSTSRVFLKILHNKRGKEVHENYINGFSKKKSFGESGLFWA